MYTVENRLMKIKEWSLYRISFSIEFASVSVHIKTEIALHDTGNTITNPAPSPSLVSTFSSPPCAFIIS
jgi:hypothetical protein